MKLKTALLLCLSLLFFKNSLYAQAPTTNGGEYNYLYRLNKEQVRWMIDSPWVSNTNWILTDLVDSVKVNNRYSANNYRSLRATDKKKGYYLQVNFTELAINTNLFIDQQFFPTLQETNGDWWFIMRDTMQNIVKNGKLTIIKSDEEYKDTIFTYDSSCLCYQVPKLVQDHWFLFEADDAFYYMYMQSPYKKIKSKWWKFWKKSKIRDKNSSPNYRYRPRLGRRIVNWVGGIGRVFKQKPTLMSLNPGYIVINQPKFKHDDTLKMKSFLVNRRGKPLRKKLVLQLTTNDNRGTKILFTQKIKPITRGAYIYEFLIPDSFDLDKNYTLSIRADKYRRKKVRKGRKWKKTKEKVLVGKTYKYINFKVEDYELNKIKYTWEDRKGEYYRGKQIWLYAKAVDANNLPVPDAKVHLRLNIRRINDTYDSLISIADTVFRNYFDTTLNCSPDGLTPIMLPGYLLPNADIEVQGTMTFTNADNKPGTATHYFKVLANSRRYYVVEDSNGVRAGYLVQGSDSVGTKAKWRVQYGNVFKDKDITLPYYQDWEHGATKYILITDSGRLTTTYSAPRTPPQPPQINIEKKHDSLYVSFYNPLGLEVAYRIYNDEELLTKGAATQIDYAIKLKGKKPVRVRYTYSWAGGIFTKEAVGWVKEKQLNVKINQPTTVFPGQDVAVDITVTDYKNRPVKKTNLTAYALNMEMDGVAAPQLPYYGKSYGSKLSVKLLNYPANWFGNQNYSINEMDNKMFHTLQLYRFPYYRLIYAPNAIGIEYDSLSDGKTQLSLFALDREPKKGIQKIKGAYAIWLDNDMVYYNVSNNLRNAFTVSPGKHKLKIRSAYYMYEFDIDIKKGWRNLIGINADSVFLNKNISAIEFDYSGLDTAEKEAYSPNNAKVLFIGADNKRYRKNRYNNGVRIQNSYIKQGSKVYQVSLFNKSYYVKPYSYRITAPLNEGEVELIMPNDDTSFTFYFNPAYMYFFDGKTIKPYKDNFQEVAVFGLPNKFSFSDTVVEIPPFAKVLKEKREKDVPKVNKITVYKPKTIFDHPMVKAYNHPRFGYAAKRAMVRVESVIRGRPAKTWFFNKDTFEFSSINFNHSVGKTQFNLVPGNYDILLATDTHSYKIIRNFKVDTGFYKYFKPSVYGYTPYDSLELRPFIEKVKLLNRGPVVPFHKSPVKLTVKLDLEKSKNEKVIGEFSVNGRFIYNALVIVEDGRGNYITAGTTNSYGFYQIPVLPGNYTLKIYTPQWDMFYTENVSVVKNNNTIAHLNVVGYSARLATKNYKRLPPKQRSSQPNSSGRRPGYTNTVNANCSGNCGEIRGLVKDAATGEELIGVNIVLEGTNIGIATDVEGSYSIKKLKPGTYTIIAKYIGYENQSIVSINVVGGRATYVNFELRENTVEISEVQIASGSYRGERDYNASAPPTLFSDDYDGIDEVMAEESIQSVPQRANYSLQSTKENSLSKVEAISVGGSRSKGTAYYVDGVRVVGNVELEDKKFVERNDEDERLQQMLGNSQAMRIRKDFRDYAYWIPNLLTNRKGKTGFTVRIPDNQTQWVTYVPAMDYKRKTGLGVAYMRAYKPITANLSLPNFMVVNDKLQLYGKTVNYTSDSVVLNTTLKVNDSVLISRPMGVRYFDTALFSYQPKKGGINSLLYQIQLPNGYLDGDQRKLSIKENGLLISDGETRTLKGNVNFTLFPTAGYKNRQVILSNKKAELVMAEINQLKNYQYGCVEQTASKLKALLLEKELSKSLNKEFTDEAYIKTCIKQLKKYQNKDGSWGWWANSPANNWMTMYAADALYKAQKAGYRTNAALAGASYINTRYRYLSIQEKLKALNLFSTMRFRKIGREVLALDKLNLNLQDRLMLMRAKQLQGYKINIDSVAKTVRLVGEDQAAWGEKLFSIYVNELSTSAVAYEILSADKKKHGELLKKVRNYFLQQPSAQRNTIQSATFLETFLRDIVTEDQKRKELIPELKLNGREEKSYSLKLDLGENDTLNIAKNGSELYYLYSWQNFVANPPTKSKDFKISSYFKQGSAKGDLLEAGKPVTLHVEVSMAQAKDYVMIEIPIPAGFSYQSKAQSRRFGEVHREYYNDKVSIFFTNLNKGHYYFEVELLPQFKGQVTLLPAKAEEMYFPMHSGNNTKRIITIK